LPEPLVSAVVLNWNGGDLVFRCLESLRRQTHPRLEVVVVDNGSLDGSLQRLEKVKPPVRILRNPTNLGFAVAANQGIAAAEGDWVLLANLDVELEPDYVERLLEAARADARIGSVTGKLLRAASRDPASPPVLDSAGHVVFRNSWAGNRGEGELDHGQFDRAEEVFGVTAAAALYSRRMLAEVSDGQARPFDERFFAYIEDVDLDWRARWLGWKSWYVPVVAWHHRSATGARRTVFILRHILKNRLLLAANNDLWPEGLLRLPEVVVFTAMVTIGFTLESGRAALGLVDFLRCWRGSGARRRFLRRKRTVGGAEVGRWLQPFPYLRKIRARLFEGKARAAEG